MIKLRTKALTTRNLPRGKNNIYNPSFCVEIGNSFCLALVDMNKNIYSKIYSNFVEEDTMKKLGKNCLISANPNIKCYLLQVIIPR